MNRLAAPRTLFLAMAVAAAGLLAVAFFLEHRMGMAPCPLCMMQRIWVGLAGLLGLAAAIHGGGIRIWAGAVAFAAAVGSGFSLRQLWLQSLPADQVPACGPDLYYMVEVFPWTEVLHAMTVGTGDCAEVHQLFGVSIPAWVLAAFLLFIAASVVAWRQAPGGRSN